MNAWELFIASNFDRVSGTNTYSYDFQPNFHYNTKNSFRGIGSSYNFNALFLGNINPGGSTRIFYLWRRRIRRSRPKWWIPIATVGRRVLRDREVSSRSLQMDIFERITSDYVGQVETTTLFLSLQTISWKMDLDL